MLGDSCVGWKSGPGRAMGLGGPHGFQKEWAAFALPWEAHCVDPAPLPVTTTGTLEVRARVSAIAPAKDFRWRVGIRN